MVDFGSLGRKAKNFIDEHEDQVDKNIDKAADAAGDRFGHSDQIDKVAGKLQGMTGDAKDAVDPDQGDRSDQPSGRHARPE